MCANIPQLSLTYLLQSKQNLIHLLHLAPKPIHSISHHSWDPTSHSWVYTFTRHQHSIQDLPPLHEAFRDSKTIPYEWQRSRAGVVSLTPTSMPDDNVLFHPHLNPRHGIFFSQLSLPLTGSGNLIPTPPTITVLHGLFYFLQTLSTKYDKG